MPVMEQKHKQDSRKRISREQIENGGPEKKKMKEEEPEHTVSHPGYLHSLLQMFGRANGTQRDQPCCIESVFRRDLRVGPGEAYGKLLKAGSHRTLKTVDVAFTGTDPSDPATEFFIEKNDNKQADALRYRSGDDNYYLKFKKSGKVNLRKLVKLPTNDIYYFQIKSIGPRYGDAIIFQSLKTKEYLHCGNDGEIFMKKVKLSGNHRVPEDRQTWFQYKPRKQQRNQIRWCACL